MKEVFFQNILIADISKKVAKWQQFSKGLNVVTGIDIICSSHFISCFLQKIL